MRLLCPYCLRLILRRKDGSIRKHYGTWRDAWRHLHHCPGSGYRPQELWSL